MFIPEIQWIFVLSGLAVGFIVGMTGVGGGSLMTPILLFFGIQPSTAVGTDLLYAAVTKSGGIFVHHKKKTIDWRITRLLAYGSLPAAAFTLITLQGFDLHSESTNVFIKMMLGYTIIATAVAILMKDKMLELSHRRDWIFTRMTLDQREKVTVVVGALMGVLVTLTSIGAGVLGTVTLFLLYPMLPVATLVGTEIAHAVPLTLLAGLGHAGVGNVDWPLLFNLLLGSLPGIYVGSHLPTAIPEKVLRVTLSIVMILIGIKLVL